MPGPSTSALTQLSPQLSQYPTKEGVRGTPFFSFQRRAHHPLGGEILNGYVWKIPTVFQTPLNLRPLSWVQETTRSMRATRRWCRGSNAKANRQT